MLDLLAQDHSRGGASATSCSSCAGLRARSDELEAENAALSARLKELVAASLDALASSQDGDAPSTDALPIRPPDFTVEDLEERWIEPLPPVDAIALASWDELDFDQLGAIPVKRAAMYAGPDARVCDLPATA